MKTVPNVKETLAGNDVGALDAMGDERVDDEVPCGFGQLCCREPTRTGTHRSGRLMRQSV